ncbi:MAG: hypothetical protein SPE30_02145 [Candidatus Treponema excrementipullorum]|nr:hypothetical protein [Candidatus Treponema excrementipullorum]
MKKYLTLLFLVCAVALTFTGCYNSFESVRLSGDGNHSSGGTVNPGGGSDKPSGGSDKPSGGSADLIGTTWMYEENYSGMTYTLKFTSEENFTLEYKVMEVSSSILGTYTYSNNTVILSPDNLPDAHEFRGSVSGNKMTIKATSVGLGDLVLTKR